MTHKLLKTGFILSFLSSALFAQQGEFTKLDNSTINKVKSEKFKAGIMADTDYGFGATGELAQVLDIKLGIQGVGADFHIWHMDFQDKSAFLQEHPLQFYVSAGLGYRWDDVGEGDGFIFRTPIGADWQFSKIGWSAYLEVGPSYNFGADKNNKRNGFNLMSGTGIRYKF